MGNLFSGHFTHYRPPFRRRRSKLRADSHRHLSRDPSANSAFGSGRSQQQQHRQSLNIKSIQHLNNNNNNNSSSNGGHHRSLSSTGSGSSSTAADQQSQPPQPPSQQQLPHTQSQLSLHKKERKPSLKMALKRVYSNACTTSPNVFTDERRQLVQTSWQEISERLGKVEFVVVVFENLFRASPPIRSMFDVDFDHHEEHDDDDDDRKQQTDVSGRGGSKLVQTTSFARHVQVFANVLDLAVRNALDLESEVGPVLIMFGRRHFNKHNVDFRNHYLALFAQSISEAINANLSEPSLANQEVLVAWRLFISYVIRKVKEGYDLEAMQRRK